MVRRVRSGANTVATIRERERLVMAKDFIDLDAAIESNGHGANDTTRLLQVSQVENLDRKVEAVREYGTEELYISNDVDDLNATYAGTICNLLELEKLAVELRTQASKKFKVLSE